MNHNKKNIKKFTARSNIQRRDRAKRELMRAVAETGVGYDALKIKMSEKYYRKFTNEQILL